MMLFSIAVTASLIAGGFTTSVYLAWTALQAEADFIAFLLNIAVVILSALFD